MRDEDKTKKQLIEESGVLRKKLAELEKISDRCKRAADEASRMVTVVRDSNDAITIQNLKGEILAWNHGAELMYGYSEKEALQKNIEHLTPPDKVAEQTEFTNRLLAGEKITSFETRRLTNDGRILDVWMTVTKLVDDTGKIIGIASTERDITERKKNQIALRQSQERFRAIFDQAHEFMTILSPEGAILDVNKRISSMGAYSPDLLGRSFWNKEFWPSDPSFHEQFNKARTGESVTFATNELDQEGILHSIENTISPIFDSEGEVQFFIASGNDITDRKQAEEKIKHLNRVLRAIRNVNQLITKEKDRDRLIKRACEYLISTKGYFNAWIALLDESGKFITIAEAGLGKDFLPMIELMKSGKKTGCGKKSSKKKDIVIIENPLIECKDCPLSGKYANRSAMTIRLEYEGKIYGFMSVSIPEELIKDEEEHNLFREIAEDIAFTLCSIEVEKEHGHAEERIKFLSSVVEQSSEGMAVADLEGNLLFVNPTWAQMHGYESDEVLVGKPLTVFHNQEQFEMEVEPFNQKVKKNGSHTSEVGHIRKDGTPFPTRMTTTILNDPKGNPIAIAGIAIDITEFKRVEGILKERERLLVEVGDIAKIGGWEMDLENDGKAVWTKGTYDIVEMDPDEPVPGLNEHLDWYLPEYRGMIKKKMQDLIETRQPMQFEAMLRTQKGNLKWCQALGEVVEKDTKVIKLRGTFQDITERKHAEKKIRELARFPTDNPNPVLRISRDGTILYSNNAGEPLLNYWCCKKGEQLGGEWHKIVIEAMRTKKILKAEVEYGGRFLSLTFAPFVEAGFVNVYGLDITERKRMEEERISMEAQLRQSQKLESIGTLASGVAHEINNPLMGIINYGQLINNRVQDKKLKQFSSGIIKEGNRVDKIVKNLLSFARQDKQSHSPALLEDIIDASLNLIGSLLRKDQITIELEIPDALPKIKCRSQQIEQVIINLLTNARDALNSRYEGYHENKIVKISAKSFEKDGVPWVRTIVEDHGTGMSPDVIARIFDPFFTTKSKAQGPVTDDRDPVGTGLGLSVSYGIIKEHNGTLSVESEPGEYSRFIMDLRVNNGWSLEKQEDTLSSKRHEAVVTESESDGDSAAVRESFISDRRLSSDEIAARQEGCENGG